MLLSNLFLYYSYFNEYARRGEYLLLAYAFVCSATTKAKELIIHCITDLGIVSTNQAVIAPPSVPSKVRFTT